MSIHHTQPLPAAAPAHITYRPGDHISALVEHDGEHRRLVGTITDSTWWIFRVRWDGGHGVAVYTHGHEPDHLRHATPDDEHAALHRTTRHTVAAELARLADTHPHWPTQVRHTLRGRAAQLTGDTR